MADGKLSYPPAASHESDALTWLDSAHEAANLADDPASRAVVYALTGLTHAMLAEAHVREWMLGVADPDSMAYWQMQQEGVAPARPGPE